ncbi:MAG: hypothetical protein K0Q66_331, partial [Chitinophagaceae bacterium]|nr:hypothetical protein [Chitinophagaceae bacterium]
FISLTWYWVHKAEYPWLVWPVVMIVFKAVFNDAQVRPVVLL